MVFCESHCVERDSFLATPGSDPDALIVGNNCSEAARRAGLNCGNLSHDEERTQLALWALAGAPLQIGAELRSIPEASRALLQNTEVLAIQGDSLGRPAYRFRAENSGDHGWLKPLLGGSVAIALVNMGESPARLGFDPTEAGFAPGLPLTVRDVYSKQDIGTAKAGTRFAPEAVVPAHGVHFLRLSVRLDSILPCK